MGVLTLIHEFTAPDDATEATISEDVTWDMLTNVGDNIIILKNVTAVFSSKYHGCYSGLITSDTFLDWGIASFTSSSGSKTGSIDLRIDPTEAISSNDVHILIGRVDRVGATLAAKLDFKFLTTTSADGFNTAITPVSSATPGADTARIVKVVLTFEYNHETFQT